MRSRLLLIVALIACAAGAVLHSSSATEPKKKIRDGAYYEFRGHLYDRSTIEHNFTLYWSEGSQPITVTRDTRIYRKGRPASLADVKSGDAVCGVGQAHNGRLIAVAVAFGEDGVELPASAKVPASITLPNNTGD